MNKENIAALNAELAESRPTRIRIADNGSEFLEGQLRSLRGGCGDQPTWLVLITAVHSDDLVVVYPCFRWGELAGPDDVYLPPQLAGVPLFVCLDMPTSLTCDTLARCFDRTGPAGLAYLARADASLDADDELSRSARAEFEWGLPYFRDTGSRAEYHGAINDTLASLQAPIRRGIL